jgi:DNA-directed RNA polymerase specialized sigma24 family protein
VYRNPRDSPSAWTYHTVTNLIKDTLKDADLDPSKGESSILVHKNL